jgi:hypothetical protein
MALMLTLAGAGVSGAPATTPSTVATTTTIRELLQLKAAGVSDDVLIALIESDGSVFRLTAEDIIDLRRQGLSERVILAMLATARRAVAPPRIGVRDPIGQPTRLVQPPPAAPGTVAGLPGVPDVTGAPGLAGTPPLPVADPDAPDVPDLPATGALPDVLDEPDVPDVNVTQIVDIEQRVETPRERTRYVEVPVAVPVAVPVRRGRPAARPNDARPAPRAAAPTYWGWGGQQAPGTWGTARSSEKPKPAEAPPARSGGKPGGKPRTGGRGGGGGAG